MIIWSGYGYLILVFFILPLFISKLVFLDTLGISDSSILFYSLNNLLLIASGVGAWFLGKYLYKRDTRTLVDPETQEKVMLKASHAFFFIPLHFWGVIMVVLSVVHFMYRTVLS